jgi:hypothetical protein
MWNEIIKDSRYNRFLSYENTPKNPIDFKRRENIMIAELLNKIYTQERKSQTVLKNPIGMRSMRSEMRSEPILSQGGIITNPDLIKKEKLDQGRGCELQIPLGRSIDAYGREIDYDETTLKITDNLTTNYYESSKKKSVPDIKIVGIAEPNYKSFDEKDYPYADEFCYLTPTIAEIKTNFKNNRIPKNKYLNKKKYNPIMEQEQI